MNYPLYPALHEPDTEFLLESGTLRSSEE